MSAAGAKRRTADPSGAGGGSGGATSRKGGSSGNDKFYSQQKSHEDLEEELQTAIRRLDDVKAYQDDEFIAELEALSRARDEKLTALAPLYKGDKPGHATDRSSAGITKTTTARTSVENQRRAISDEYEAARAKVCDRITTNLENVQKTARAEIEALVEQGGQQGRVRRKTRARGEAGGFLADREKAINVAHRLQEIVAKVLVTKEDLEGDLNHMRHKTAKERDREHKERDKEAAKAASAEREKESAKAAADRDKASSKNGKAAGGGPKATSAAGKAGVAAAKVTKASQPQPKKAGLLPPKAAGPAKDVRESAGGKAGAKKAENGRAQGPSPVNGGVGGRRSPARFLEKNSDGGMTGGTKEATGRKSPASLVSPRAGNANADAELDKERGVSTTDTPKAKGSTKCDTTKEKKNGSEGSVAADEVPESEDRVAVVASKGETSKSKSGKRGSGAGEAMPGAQLSPSPAKSDKGKADRKRGREDDLPPAAEVPSPVEEGGRSIPVAKRTRVESVVKDNKESKMAV